MIAALGGLEGGPGRRLEADGPVSIQGREPDVDVRGNEGGVDIRLPVTAEMLERRSRGGRTRAHPGHHLPIAGAVENERGHSRPARVVILITFRAIAAETPASKAFPPLRRASIPARVAR